MTCTPTRALLRSTTAFAVLAGLAPAAMAQQDEGAGFLGTILLGESKRAVQTETATPETVVDSAEIEDRQAGTIAELVDSVPGVTLVNGSTPQGSGINIRGFGATSTYGSDQKVLIIVDGATTGAEELYRIGTQLFTDPALYEQVSVIRGTVGSFEFGSGVVGGVVQLDSKDASDFTGGVPGFAARQTLQYSSNGDGLVSSTILAWQPSERLEFLGNFTWRQQDDQVDGSGATIGSSAYELPSGLLKGRYSFGENLDHALSFSYAQTSSEESDVPYDTFATSDSTFGNVDRQIDSRIATLRYEYNPVGNDLIDLDVTLSYADQEIVQEYVPGSSVCDVPPYPSYACGFPFEEGGFDVVNADHRYETTKLTAKNTARFGTGAVDHELRAGLELIRKERLDANSAPGGTDDRVAVFAVDEMRFGNLTLTPALRWETSHIEGNPGSGYGTYDNDALMGGVSARYEFDSGLAVFASAAYTESLPIIDDLGTPSYMTRPEKAQTYEVGASYAALDVFTGGDRLALKANAYRTELWDVTSYSGVTRVEMEGIEVEASYALDSGFYVDLNAANYLDGVQYDTAGVQADWQNLPADAASLTLGRKFGERLDLSWETVANREATVNGTTHGGFAVHNLRATYVPQSGLAEGVELRAGIENAFDLDYTPRLSTRPAPGRTFKVSVARTF